MGSLAAGLWVVKLNQIDPCLPRNYFLHLGQELLTLCALFGGALLIISIHKLLAAHHPSPVLDLRPYSRAGGLGFPGSPLQSKIISIIKISSLFISWKHLEVPCVILGK